MKTYTTKLQETMKKTNKATKLYFNKASINSFWKKVVRASKSCKQMVVSSKKYAS